MQLKLLYLRRTRFAPFCVEVKLIDKQNLDTIKLYNCICFPRNVKWYTGTGPPLTFLRPVFPENRGRFAP